MKNKIKKFFAKRPALGYFLLTLLLVLFTFAFEKGVDFFQAQIMKAPPFDGTARPVRKVPNWVKVGGANTRRFENYQANELVDFPNYDLATLQSTKTDDDTRNAQLTFPVVYLGNYQLDHVENGGSHLAVDIKLPNGTPLFAVANGVVEKVQISNSGFGNHVCLKHEDVPTANGTENLFSCFCHMETVSVAEGQIVTKGQKIGTSGESGTATTPHLHFQIDREQDSAGAKLWHPWWPFTSAQATAANLSFFDAINAGLGKQEAKANTINPLLWVQEHLNAQAVENADSSNTEKKAENETVTGNDSPKQDVEKTETVVVKPEPANFSIAVASTVLAGSSTPLKVQARDSAGTILPEFILKSDLKFSVVGNCQVEPVTLKIADFAGGVAQVNLLGKKAGTCKITLIGWPKSQVEISVTQNAKPIARFSVEKSGDLHVGKKQTVEITALDASGELTQKSLSGFAQVKLLSGQGKFSSTQLSAKDFQNGRAQVEFTPSENSTVQIKVQSGVLVGQSEKMAVTQMVQFSDVSESHVHFRAITALREQGIIGGYSDGTFRPEAPITRVAVLKMLLLGLGIPIQGGTVAFSDTGADQWYQDFLHTAVENGIVNGFPDGSFRPAANIVRASFFKMLLNTAKVSLPAVSRDPFQDVPASEWFARHAAFAKSEKLLDFASGKFEGERQMTRGEVAESIFRLMQIL